MANRSSHPTARLQTLGLQITLIAATATIAAIIQVKIREKTRGGFLDSKLWTPSAAKRTAQTFAMDAQLIARVGDKLIHSAMN